MTFIHISTADKRDGIPAIGEGRPCNQQGCPGPDGWESGFGLAGGGYGPYTYCEKCGEITEKNCMPDDDGAADAKAAGGTA